MLILKIKSYIFSFEPLKNKFVNNANTYFEIWNNTEQQSKFIKFFEQYYINPVTKGKQFETPKIYPDYLYYPVISHCIDYSKDDEIYKNLSFNPSNGVIEFYTDISDKVTLTIGDNYTEILKNIDDVLIIKIEPLEQLFYTIERVFEQKNFRYQFTLCWLKSLINGVLSKLISYTQLKCRAYWGNKIDNESNNFIISYLEKNKKPKDDIIKIETAIQKLKGRALDVFYDLWTEPMLTTKQLENKYRVAHSRITNLYKKINIALGFEDTSSQEPIKNYFQRLQIN